MTYEQIAEMMEEMGLPFAYHHFAVGESPAPPFLLRCKQLGLSMTELDMLTIGLINDMFTERENDDFDGWHEIAGQADFDSF